jgi:CheY-like chemotaxis protein
MSKILHLNDNRMVLHVAEKVLKPKNFDFLYTTSSGEALSILRQECIDLFIQDILRPDMNGFEFYWLMKSDKKLCDIPILILSMWAAVEAPVKLTPITVGGRKLRGIYRAAFNNYKPEYLKKLTHIKDPNILFIEGHACKSFPATLTRTVVRILKNQSMLTDGDRSLRNKYLWSKASKGISG